MLLPPKVQPGDRVHLVALAPAPSQASLDEVVERLTSWGLTVDVAVAATDDEQLAAINTALRAPDVRAVITTGGGDYVHRIADRLDFAAVRDDPKPVVSTFTQIHLALWRECQVAGVYGSLDGDRSGESAESLRSALTTGSAVAIHRLPGEITAGVLAPGRATGTVVAGRLSALRRMIGVGLPSLASAVLLLTDQRTIGLGQVDRQLTHLKRSGLLDGIRGVAVGEFTGFDGFEDRGWTLVDVLQDQLGSLGVPVLGGLPMGCGPNSLAVPTGTVATLDTDTGTLTVEPAVR